MRDHDQALAALKRYVNKRGYCVGSGNIVDRVNAVLSGRIQDPEAIRLLDNVMKDPFQAGVLLNLMADDLLGRKRAPKKKIRRGVGSY